MAAPNNNNNHKVKGLLKGLRYISHMFENEKEQEMQIGNPTDVKHVAHIGWDGPSVNTPSWMNEFKAGSGPDGNGDVRNNEEPDSAVKWDTEESRGVSTRSVNSPERDLPDLPKASRRQTAGETASPNREKPEKPRQRRTKLKDSSDGSTRPTRHSTHNDSAEGSESPARSDVPKKSRRKKSKLKGQNSDQDSSVSEHKPRNKGRSFDDEGESEKG